MTAEVVEINGGPGHRAAPVAVASSPPSPSIWTPTAASHRPQRGQPGQASRGGRRSEAGSKPVVTFGGATAETSAMALVGRMTDWQVRTGSLADLDLVGPLWVAVHHRHAETMPQLAPYVSDDETWSGSSRDVRGSCWPNPTPCCCSRSSAKRPWAMGWHTFWRWTTHGSQTPGRPDSRIGEIESLSVLPQCAAAGSAPNCSPTRAAPACHRSQGSDPGRAAGQYRRHPPLRKARLSTDLALPVPVSG